MSDHICLSDIQFSAVTKNGFKDVSILTVGEASGHGVMVDEKTIEDFVKLSIGKTIPAYLTHAGAVDASGRAADRLGKEIGMSEAIACATQLLAGQVRGRVMVDVNR